MFTMLDIGNNSLVLKAPEQNIYLKVEATNTNSGYLSLQPVMEKVASQDTPYQEKQFHWQREQVALRPHAGEYRIFPAMCSAFVLAADTRNEEYNIVLTPLWKTSDNTFFSYFQFISAE